MRSSQQGIVRTVALMTATTFGSLAGLNLINRAEPAENPKPNGSEPIKRETDQEAFDLSQVGIKLREQIPEAEPGKLKLPVTFETATLKDVAEGRQDPLGNPLAFRPQKPTVYYPAVDELQHLLIRGYGQDLSPFYADGKFGDVTTAALKRTLNSIDYKFSEPIVVDAKMAAALIARMPDFSVPVYPISATLLDVARARTDTYGKPVTYSYLGGSVVRSPAIKKAQERLLEEGFSVGSAGADSKMGDDTSSALAKYQSSRGIPVMRPVILNAETARALLERRGPIETENVKTLKSTEWYDEFSPKTQSDLCNFVKTCDQGSLNTLLQIGQTKTFKELGLESRFKLFDVLRKLPADGRTQLLVLTNRLIEGSSNPAILDHDSMNRTTLELLHDLASRPFHPDLAAERTDYLAAVVSELANPYQANNQGYHGTCSVTAGSCKAIMERPAEMMRISRNLAGAHEYTRLADGESILVRVSDSLSADKSTNRSPSERLRQASLMCLGSNAPYNNTLDAFVDPQTGEEISWGLSLDATAKVLSAIYGTPFETVEKKGSGEKLLRRLEQEPGSLTCVALRWRKVTDEERKQKRYKNKTYSYHMVNFVAVDRQVGRVYYRNPHGPSGSPDGAQLSNPKRTLDDASQAIESMTIDDWCDRMHGAVLQK